MRTLRFIACLGFVGYFTTVLGLAQTVVIDHEKMIQLLRQTLAKERCDTCCSTTANTGRKACTVCACADHSLCPKPPVLTSQQARLEALLEDYRADKITPSEYQQQRAKIRAEL